MESQDRNFSLCKSVVRSKNDKHIRFEKKTSFTRVLVKVPSQYYGLLPSQKGLFHERGFKYSADIITVSQNKNKPFLKCRFLGLIKFLLL